MFECFHGAGNVPEEMERLNIVFSGWAIACAVLLSIWDVMPSAPGEVWLGRVEISVTISSEEHRYSSGQCMEAGGSGIRGGQEVVASDLKKQLFSSCVFSSSV